MHRARGLDPKRGAALLFVVVIVGLLALAVVQFQRRTHLESVSATNSVRALQAHALTRSGYAAAAMLLRTDMTLGNNIDDRNEVWFPGDEAGSAMPIPVNNDVVTIRIEDQFGKFPIAALLDAQGDVVPDHLRALVKLFEGLDFEEVNPDDLALALVDWIDADNHGEYEYNQNFAVPNTPPEHIDELGRIELFDNLSPAQLAELARHLDTRAAKEINAYTAPPAVLYAMNATIGFDEAQELYDDLPDNTSLLGTYLPKNTRYLPFTTQSTRFRILIGATVGGVTRKVDCTIERNDADQSVKLVDWSQY